MLAPLLAAFAFGTADVPTVFADVLPDVKAKTTLPILLPQTYTFDVPKLYASGSGHKRSWDLALAGAPDCGGANVCFEAEFSASTAGAPYGRGKATLTGGRHARYAPLQCGASCSAPSIAWRQHGATYTIRANLVGKGSDRSQLIKLANSAIRAGAR
jgi:hypothetical protein